MLTKFIPYLRLAPAALIAVLALIAVIQWAEARHWQKRYIASEKAHTATVERYKSAQSVAAELNKAKVARIEREYEIAGQKAEATHEKLIATNRANLAGWLRSKAAQGASSSPGTSEGSPMPQGTVQGTGEAVVLIADLEIVADAYAQLDALRAWALDIGRVKTD